jgi:selenide,water dikinase
VTSGRFIELATHGGCSRKVNAIRLEGLLEELELEQGWADAALIEIGGSTLATTVDIVLPMIDDPATFGEIVVAHVLSDLYATGATPVFGVNVLGAPEKLVHDASIREMLTSAKRSLERAGAKLLGGHSIESKELFFGLSATGWLRETAFTHDGARVGDQLVLTKPLGTSIASWAWRKNRAPLTAHADVVAGMRELNATAGDLLAEAGAHACTDVSGFGLAGHLHNLLAASDVSARVFVDALPRYESTRHAATAGCTGSRLLHLNEDYVLGKVTWPDGDPSHTTKLYVYDAQVSGGLLAAVAEEAIGGLLSRAAEERTPMFVIGRFEAGDRGRMLFE